MSCKTGCVCRCGMTGCACYDGLAIVARKGPNPNELLMLRNLPQWECCSHCKTAYCPDAAGHHAPCPISDCAAGNRVMERVFG